MRLFLLVFGFVCLCGFVVAMASGAQWGTPNCGGITALTLLGGIICGFVAVVCWGESDD